MREGADDALGVGACLEQHVDDALPCGLVLELDGEVERRCAVEAVLQVDVDGLEVEKEGEDLGRGARDAARGGELASVSS